MRCVFGIDVSKATISLAIVVDQSLIEEFKLPMNRTGFRKLKSLIIPKLFLKLLVSTLDDFNAF